MLVDMGDARLAATLVRDRVLHAGVSLAMAGRRDAHHFSCLRRVLTKRSAGPFVIGADTLGSD